MIKSLTFNQLLTYEGERFAQSFNITIERMLFFRWCQILVPKFWIGFQYWANVWNDSTICLWKTQQEVLDSPVLECRNWRSERPLWRPSCSKATASASAVHVLNSPHQYSPLKNNSLGPMQWLHMATKIWVDIDSGNGLLPDCTMPLPEPMLTNHHSCLLTVWFTSGQFHRIAQDFYPWYAF